MKKKIKSWLTDKELYSAEAVINVGGCSDIILKQK